MTHQSYRYPREIKTYVCMRICTHISIVASCQYPKAGSSANTHLVLNEILAHCTMAYYSKRIQNGILIHVTAQINLKFIIAN